MNHLLIVEDDAVSRRLLHSFFTTRRFHTTLAASGEEALRHTADADAVLLDLGLPDMDGLEVAARIRERHRDLPILMATGRTDVDDRIRGLTLGADDYITKPYDLRELHARIEACLRRSGLSGELAFGELLIHLQSRQVRLAGRPLELSRLEFDILAALARHPGAVWSRERLLDTIWGDRFPTTLRTVDTRIFELRRKLQPNPDSHAYIDTVRGVGYRFTAPPEAPAQLEQSAAA